MKVVTQAIPIISFVPRLYPLLSDTLTLAFEDGFIIPFSFVLDKNMVVITLESTSDFIQRGNYSFTVFLGTEIIYKGKIIFLKNGTDVQNYTNQSQDNKRWKK